jgi:hypothetical protein
MFAAMVVPSLLLNPGGRDPFVALALALPNSVLVTFFNVYATCTFLLSGGERLAIDPDLGSPRPVPITESTPMPVDTMSGNS